MTLSRALRMGATVMIVTLAVVLPAQAASTESVAFAVDVEQVKGHLIASADAYAAGQRVRAQVHASHPIQELGRKIYGPPGDVEPALGGRVREALTWPGRDIAAKVTPARYAETVRRVADVLDEALKRVVPEAERSSVAFTAMVIRGLLDLVQEEYSEAVAGGKIVLDIEYQDGYGFFRRAQALHRAIAPRLAPASPDTAKALDRHFTVLGRALPGVRPPAKPLSTEQVEAEVRAMAELLATLVKN